MRAAIASGLGLAVVLVLGAPAGAQCDFTMNVGDWICGHGGGGGPPYGHG